MQFDYRSMINVFHMFVIAPLLLYIGWKGDQTEEQVFNIVIGAGLVAVIYHAYRYMNTKWWINLIHIPAGLALAYIGYLGTGMPPEMFQLILASGVGIFLWHAYLLAESYNLVGADATY